MHTSPNLYLASQSPIRRHLLEKACIPFQIIPQSTDERTLNWDRPVLDVVPAIARLKMDHALLPPGEEKEHRFVLTADTLCVDHQGKVHGKPVDITDAIRMIKLWRLGCSVVTAFCLDKKIYSDGTWRTETRREQTVSSSLNFSIPDRWIEEYLRRTKPLEIAGAVAIEGYGFQFVKSIAGSYTTILGLPMYELIEALTELQFFSSSPTS